ncbi:MULTISPECIES: hypothetical protein [Edwardsiella]|uniref:hypothetical protein n=1 Tax=Edwardsiella TaxID=635 RepID=UPI0035299620
MAWIRRYANADTTPAFMGMGPVPITKKVLQRNRPPFSDIDPIEAHETHEAFSSPHDSWPSVKH